MQPKKHKKTNSRPKRAVWTVFVNCAHWRGSTLAIYKTVLIIFPLNLQTITITLDVVKWRWGRRGCRLRSEYEIFSSPKCAWQWLFLREWIQCVERLNAEREQLLNTVDECKAKDCELTQLRTKSAECDKLAACNVRTATLCQTPSKTQTDRETSVRLFVCCVRQGRPFYGWTKRDAS